MKRIPKLLIIAAAVAGLSSAADVSAQPGKGRGPGPAARQYNTNTVETVRGKVVSVEKTAPPQDRGYGVHLVLKTDKETIPVHLGPASYLEKQKPRIEGNDTVEVTGSRVTLNEKPAIVAAKVKKGTEVLALRDETGRPLWAGTGRRRGPPTQ